uniref:Hexosyltransferase n=1 Tax=Panagrolaimus sp. ES5 TaxID=591445 RepID=A0AC34GL64_9BILA
MSCFDTVVVPQQDGSQQQVQVVLPKTFLLIVIMSSPSDSDIRDTIRNTWLKLSAKGPSHFRWIFPIGISKLDETTMSGLRMEQTQFEDLAFLPNVTESYDNLARKTAQAIYYSTQNYDFQFLLKVDSDSFVRV